MDISEDAGLLQIDAALTHLTEHRNDPNDDAEWSISVTPRGGEGGRGIYLRTEDDCTKVQEFVVEAIPKVCDSLVLQRISP